MKDNNMPKIIKLNSNHIINTLEELLNLAKAGDLQNFIFAGYSNNEEIVTAKAELDILQQQNLVSYLQLDTNMRLIENRNKKEI